MASARGTIVPSSARAFDVSISSLGWTTTAVRPAGTGRRTTSAGLAQRTSTNPPYSAGAMLSACAEPAPSALAFERAHEQTYRAPAVRPTQRIDGDHRGNSACGASAETARERQPLADVQRDAARGPDRQRRAACAATPAVFFAASRGRRPPSSEMLVITTPAGPSIHRAVTSSPGSCRANPRTSNPHATLETVAGAKAVTAFIVGAFTAARRSLALRANTRSSMPRTPRDPRSLGKGPRPAHDLPLGYSLAPSCS